MKTEELAFVNQQLAGLLTAGVPLEGSLKQLTATMQRGALRQELEQLQANLSQGVPLEEALARQRLPEFYTAMVRLGARSQDLPGVLTLLADYYQKVNSVWTRLKGLMVYPTLVLLTALALSATLAFLFTALLREDSGLFTEWIAEMPQLAGQYTLLIIALWVPVLLIALLTGAVLAALFVPAIRRWARWKLPAFREASLSRFASALALMLDRGCDLREALGLLQQLEARQPVAAEVARWQQRLAGGQTRLGDLAAGGQVFPPLFLWLVDSAGEDWVAGLRRAAEVYRNRALYRIETVLYAALPVSILTLGLMIVIQMLPVMRCFFYMMQSLGSVGGF